MTKKSGSVLGGVLLIGASCIGAGMLGLPIQTGVGGYLPSMLSFFLVWLFMMLTGLLLIEVNSWHGKPVNILAMAEGTLGKTGKAVAAVLYLFLFYSVLVAFVSVSGNLLSALLLTRLDISIPPVTGSIFFVLAFGFLVYLGTKQVDFCNRALMLLKVGSFIVLVILGIRYIQPKLLQHQNFTRIPSALPILVTAFTFQNLIPTLNSYFGGNIKKTRKVVVLGSLFALIVYMIWQTVALGIIPLNGPLSIEESKSLGREASETIGLIMRSSYVGLLSQLMGFFAILTSFLAQSLSLSHFLSEGFKITYKKHENLFMCLLTLIPPLVFSLIYPGLFFKALDFAGGFCISLLFGLLPVLMVWSGRYYQHQKSNFRVFGGKLLLLCLLLFSMFIFLYQVFNMISPLIS